MLITESEYKTLKNKYDLYHSQRKLICTNQCRNTPEEQKLLPPSLTNEEISSIEVYEFFYNPPDKYFLYVDEKKGIVTTWTGEKLGMCYLGKEYRSNFGDERQAITINAINGMGYRGTYYKSSGSYARVTLIKERMTR